MKYIKAITIILIILILDQWLKIYIKTTFTLYETRPVIGDWFLLHFIENNGMAFGLEIMDGPVGKIFLSLFRLIAVGFGLVYLWRVCKKNVSTAFVVCLALLIAGAAGNLIDSMFYGMMFSNSSFHHVSHFVEFGHGYAPLFEGKVVDMLYFHLIDFTWPSWLPLIGGHDFTFFAPIFNIADFSISTGAISLLLFQKKIFNNNSLQESS